LADALELSRFLGAKRVCGSIVQTSTIGASDRESPEIAVGPRSNPPALQPLSFTEKTKVTRAKYQRVIEHLAALGVFLQVLHQTAYMPAYRKLWGLSVEELEALGYPEGMPASLGMIELWETSCIDELFWGQTTVLRMFFALKQHALLNHYSLDFEKWIRSGATSRRAPRTIATAISQCWYPRRVQSKKSSQSPRRATAFAMRRSV
jgi:hypothetical protein